MHFVAGLEVAQRRHWLAGAEEVSKSLMGDVILSWILKSDLIKGSNETGRPGEKNNMYKNMQK